MLNRLYLCAFIFAGVLTAGCATNQAPLASSNTRAAITAQGVDLVVSGCVELDQVKGAIVYAEESHALAERIAANIKTMLSAKGIPVNAVHFPFVCGFPNAERAHMVTEPGSAPKAASHPVVRAGPHAPTPEQAAEIHKWRCHMHPVQPWDYSRYGGAPPPGISCRMARKQAPLKFSTLKSYLPDSRYVLFAHAGVRTETPADQALDTAIDTLAILFGGSALGDNRRGFEAALFDFENDTVIWADGYPGWDDNHPPPCVREPEVLIDQHAEFTLRTLLCAGAPS